MLHRGAVRLTAVAFGFRGQVIAYGGFDRALVFHSLVKQKFGSLGLHSGYIRCIVSSTRALVFYSSGDDGAVFRVDLARSTYARISKQTAPVYCLALDAEETRLIGGTKDGRVLVWTLGGLASQPLQAPPLPSSNAPAEQYACGGNSIFSTGFTANAQQIFAAGADGTLILITRHTGQQRVLAQLPGAVFSVVAASDGTLYAGCSDGAIYRCDLSGASPVALVGHTDSVRWLLLDETEKRLFSASKDSTVRIWDLRGGGHRILSGHTDYVYQIALSPGRDHLVSASGDGSLRLWKL